MRCSKPGFLQIVTVHMNRSAIAFLLAAVGLCGCAHRIAVRMQPPVHFVSQTGQRFEARYGCLSDGSLGFVKVKMPDGRECTLPQALSASGARYTDERTVVWWEHQGTIRVDVRGKDGRWKEDAYPGLRAIDGGAISGISGVTERRMGQPGTDETRGDRPSRKIQLDLQSLGQDGLRGPAGGKVAVSYEFAIPDTDACKAEVKSIDPTVQFMPGSAGRVQAQKTGCLCIGSTHQDGYRKVLQKLADLPYVDRIVECRFE